MKNNKELDIKRLLDADESASLVANDLVAKEEFRRLRKTKLIKLGAVAFLSALILIFMTMHMQIKQMTAETA